VDDEVICELGTILASNPTVNVVAVLKPTQTGTRTVSASVSADQTDADATNDTASATVTVNAESDGGGFCSYHPNGHFDPVLPLLLLTGIGYLLVKSRSGKVCLIAMRGTRRKTHVVNKNH
jgi:hypothetical protein